jgi:hypothetical protein
MHPRLNLAARTPDELLTQLAAIDITVPLRTEGRTTSHCERYLAARLLSTLADTDEISFPLEIVHQEKPDFALTIGAKTVGMECTEAVSSEWAQIDAIRERDFPESMIMLPMFKPGSKTFSIEERVAIAKGRKDGPPWVGKMAERQWAEALAYFIGEKTKKLRAGNYSTFSEAWLVVQDEWRVPVYRLEDRREAAQMCAEMIQPLLTEPSFSRIYISNSSWLVRLAPGSVEVRAIRNLWH